jgi:NADPH:quinone reductase-like Zn-dependent oxidoreductase
MADHVARGRLVMAVTTIYPLEQVSEAHAEPAEERTHDKIVLSTVLPAGAKALRPT